MSDDVTPDEFGRYRVTDKDTGHKRSIAASELPHGNYSVLKQAASDPLTGEALPPEHANVAKAAAAPRKPAAKKAAAKKTASTQSSTGQTAVTPKEKANG